jgi:hypothetical protein
MTKLLQATLDRRGFLRRGAIGAAGIAAATIAACAPGAGAGWTFNPSLLPPTPGSSPTPTGTLPPASMPAMSMGPGSTASTMGADQITALIVQA